MIKKMLGLVALIAALTATTASADPGLPGTPKSKPVAKSAPAHHGMTIGLKLNEVVTDGKPAHFDLHIRRTGGTNAWFMTAAIGWSYDGNAPTRYQIATVDNLAPDLGFIYADSQWIRLGTVVKNNGVQFDLGGDVLVPDRAKDGHPYARMFCIQAVIVAEIPGKQNAGWYEKSPLRCSYYKVS
jgi:hypothetical protein